ALALGRAGVDVACRRNSDRLRHLAFLPRDWTPHSRVPKRPMPSEANVGDLLSAMKHAAAVLRDHDVPFALAGGLAIYAQGGPETEHDVDFVLNQSDAERALELLGEAGFRCERPPEAWLYKVYD